MVEDEDFSVVVRIAEGLSLSMSLLTLPDRARSMATISACRLESLVAFTRLCPYETMFS